MMPRMERIAPAARRVQPLLRSPELWLVVFTVITSLLAWRVK